MSNPIQRLRSWWKSLHKLEQQPVPEEDPITGRSLATPIAVCSLLLVVTLLWALYEEAWGLRPWEGYQKEFVELYRKVLEKRKPLRRQEEQRIRKSAGYRELERQIQEAEKAIRDDMQGLARQLEEVKRKLAAITKPFTTERSRVQAKTYELETAAEEDRPALRRELERIKAGPIEIMVPEGEGEKERSFTFEELEAEFDGLKALQGRLQSRQVALLHRPNRLRHQLQEYLRSRLTGLTENQVEGLLHSLDAFRIEIKQIHNPDLGLVDRCESCHLGIRQPLVLTAADFAGQKLFVSHPRPQLLKQHDPEVFGCSPCHNGNGVGTISAKIAHGRYEHWLWPLYHAENFEAGCQQCHEADRRLGNAPTLDAGKELFYEKGCWGCHPRQGFGEEEKQLRDTQKSVQNLSRRRRDLELEVGRTVARADQAESNQEAARLYARADQLNMEMAGLDSRVEQMRHQAEEVMKEIKKPGPNLKDVRLKLRRDWIPVWIQDPRKFRKTTKMPSFRLEEDELRAIAAFIWQSGVSGPLPKQPAGDPVRGKRLLESRGCLACHSIGEGEATLGGRFAANLSRVGEKANYDYLVRWIHNPRERTLPYCPVHKRDITPQDYASRGLPFRFDLEHNRCPLGDHLLQVEQPTVMPSLRLDWQDARDLASYLMTLKTDAVYPPADYMEDPDLAKQGKALVKHFGCAGCHEIAGLEQEGKIGTDLTKEGSKPIERLDFALLTHRAQREGWYDHKGFFEHKLADPAVFDQGKIKKPLERLRMPRPNITPEEITQLTTFLLGSVESRIPRAFQFHPSDSRKDVQQGWWVITKYNCMGCHQVTPGQQTVLERLPFYQGAGKEKLPPSLVGEGARVNPKWLASFLENPALSRTDLHRNGVRPYLDVRMPTFYLSEREIQKLVRFFNALAQQPLPYLAPRSEPLTSRELTMARTLVTHRAAPCLRCHATGDPIRDRSATAPNLMLARERLKPDWTQRWLVHPEIIRPGTAMPSGLFRQEGGRWVFALADVPILRGYRKDQSQLVVRYIFQLSAKEQRRLQAH